MISIKSGFEPEKSLETELKSWHVPFDDGILEGYIADFKTEVRTSVEDGITTKYSGVRFFINVDDKQRGGFSVFVPHDPFFYFIPKKGKEKNVIAFLKKNRRIPNTDGVKDVQVFRRHVFDSKIVQPFFTPRKIYRVVLYTPNDVPKYSQLLLKHPDVYDCKEYKIPYTIRVCNDLQLFSFRYYKFVVEKGVVRKYESLEKKVFPKLSVFTFDIEVRKKPIKKPQSDDKINVVGIKFKDQGYVFNNVGLTHFEIPNFWVGVDEKKIIRRFTKKEAMEKGWKYKPIYFKSLNVPNEEKLIRGFFNLIKKLKPQAINGYASDFFDWPHFQTRGSNYGINFKKIFDQDYFEGSGDKRNGTFFGDFRRDGVQMFDTMDWTSRDSYMPKGLQGLKDISRELLGIEAIEIDHEEQVRVWQRMENIWLNPNHPENQDPEKYEENKKRAYQETLNHAIYCASDVFVTDIFATQSSMGLNVAVASRIPMNFFQVSRKNRGPMVEADLLNRMGDKMIAPNKVMNKSREIINPVEVQKQSKSFFKEVKKTIKGTKHVFWAECLTLDQMKQNCADCKKYRCKDGWNAIWKLPANKQNPILCEKKSDPDDPTNQKYYFPLEDIDFFVVKEKYEGARVTCFNPGVFKDDADLDFEIQPNNLKKFETQLHETLDRFIKDFEKKKQEVKGYDTKIHVQIINKEKLHKKISDQFEEVLSKLEERNGIFYWRGKPVIIHVDVASMYPNIIINYNLQPHGVVSDKVCKKCSYYPKEGEKKCWVNMDWNAVYKVMNINRKDQALANDQIEKEMSLGNDLTDDDIVKIYKRFSSGSKKYNTYKFPVKTRFCQKAFKFFVNTVKSFRDERYIYKYMMIDKEEEIDAIKSNYQAHPSMETFNYIQKAIQDTNDEYVKTNVRKIKNDPETPELIVTTLSEIIDAYEKGEPVPQHVKTMTERLREKYGEQDIPIDVKIIIDDLSVEKVFARNMQLGLKVLLNSFYGYLKSIGARFWSIEAAGATCLKGQEIIDFAVDFCKFKANSINIELDSLEYNERLIFKNPQGFIENLSIGEFIDRCFAKFGIESRNIERGVEYTSVYRGWEVLSASKDGEVMWKKVKRAIRQKTDRNVFEIRTSFGKIKTTDSHSIYHNTGNQITPLEVKNIKNEYISHVSHVPNIEINKGVNLTIPNPDIELFVYIPKNSATKKFYNHYPISRLGSHQSLKFGGNGKRVNCYKIPIEKFDHKYTQNAFIGSSKGYKFPIHIPLTEELSELCGWYVSEGSSVFRNTDDRNGVDVTIAQNDGEFLDRIEYLVSKIGSYIPNFNPRRVLSDKRNGTYRIGMSNIFFYHLFMVMGCGKTSHVKRIPSVILSAPTHIKKAFLKGYFNGDGCLQNGNMRFGTISEGLRDDLCVIGRIMNYVPTIRYTKTPKGDEFYDIIFHTFDEMIKSSYYKFDINYFKDIIGIKRKKIKEVEKQGNYVYDLSVEENHNFVGTNGAIFSNTDGLWTAIPSPIPLEIEFEYTASEGEDDSVYERKFNLFNGNLNYLVKQQFTNHNNFVPLNEDGVHDPEIEYTIDWNKNRVWKNQDLCEIKFDYEGPFSTLFVYTKKRMKVYKRDKTNPKEQEIDTITGLDELRKGELGLIRRCSKEITDAYKNGTSVVNCYERACEVANKYLKQLRDHTINKELILEARDLSEKTAPNVNQAHVEYKSFLEKFDLDPKEFPVFGASIEKKTEHRPLWREIWKGKKEGRRMIEQGIFPKINRSIYTMAGFRTLDLGIPIGIGDTVEWIVTPYPRVKNRSSRAKTPYKKVKKSQRAIPSRVFDGTPEEIKNYLEIWFGEPVEKTELRDYVDWDYYIAKFSGMLERYLIEPAKNQGIDVFKWLNLKDTTKKVKRNMDITQFFHPLTGMKNDKKKTEASKKKREDLEDITYEKEMKKSSKTKKKSTSVTDLMKKAGVYTSSQKKSAPKKKPKPKKSHSALDEFF